MNGMWTLGVSCLSGLLFLSYKNQEKSLINFFQLDNYRNAIRQNYFCSHGGKAICSQALKDRRQ